MQDFGVEVFLSSCAAVTLVQMLGALGALLVVATIGLHVLSHRLQLPIFFILASMMLIHLATMVTIVTTVSPSAALVLY